MQRRITAGYARRRGRSANRSWRVILCCFQVAQIRLFRSSLRVTKLNTPSVLSNKAKITKCCNRRSARAETARGQMLSGFDDDTQGFGLSPECSAPPHFVPGKLHFKNNFCDGCRSCILVPLEQLRALSAEQAA